MKKNKKKEELFDCPVCGNHIETIWTPRKWWHVFWHMGQYIETRRCVKDKRRFQTKEEIYTGLDSGY